MRTIFSIAIIALMLAGCNPFESPFVTDCETALKATLRAPSTYRRIKVIETSEPIPLEEYLAHSDESPSVKALYRAEKIKPKRIIALFEYDAANSYNTPIRSFAKCDYESVYDDEKSPGPEFVKIDGKTKLDRMLNVIKENLHRAGASAH